MGKIVATTQEHAVEAAIAAYGSKATYTGAGASVLSWRMSSQFGVVAGVILGVAGFIVNWYYRHKANRREQEEHDLRVLRERALLDADRKD